MIDCGNVWAWTVKGLAGVCGMLGNLDADPNATPCPAESLDYLEKYRQLIAGIIERQRARQCTPNDSPSA